MNNQQPPQPQTKWWPINWRHHTILKIVSLVWLIISITTVAIGSQYRISLPVRGAELFEPKILYPTIGYLALLCFFLIYLIYLIFSSYSYKSLDKTDKLFLLIGLMIMIVGIFIFYHEIFALGIIFTFVRF